MKNKKKPLKISKGVVIGNLAVSKDNLLEALPSINKNKPKKVKILNIVCSIYKTAFVFSWSAKGIGFGEVTYYINDDGKLSLDDERLNREFVLELQKEIVKRFKKNTLEIRVSPDAIQSFFEFSNSIFYK
jgi:hypothetical protein